MAGAAAPFALALALALVENYLLLHNNVNFPSSHSMMTTSDHYVPFRSWLVFPLLILKLCSSHPGEGGGYVKVTTTPSAVQWTCFDVLSSKVCCEFILTSNDGGAWLEVDMEGCLSQLAEMPSTIAETLQVGRSEFAQYSLTLPTGDDKSRPNGTKQFIWRDHEAIGWQELDTISSPYLLQQSEPSDDLSIVSQLSDSGGMHRLLRHQIQSKVESVKAYYVFLTVPNSMFVDLDDSHEGLGALRVHAAGICDIELPAFASRQYVIVFELPSRQNSFLEFASKIHLRYPYPSETRLQTAYLPDPQLIATAKDGSLLFCKLRQEHPWGHFLIAAGSGNDYFFVMWATVFVCCVGVVIMMYDMSLVSKWDR